MNYAGEALVKYSNNPVLLNNQGVVRKKVQLFAFGSWKERLKQRNYKLIIFILTKEMKRVDFLDAS